MAFSYQEEVSNGVQTVYAIDFDFRNTETIYVYTGEHSGYATQLSWRFTNFNTQIELTNLSEVPSGTKFYIRRIVDRANLSYVFENKSMRGKFVDEQNYATLYLLQELMDGFGDLSVAQPVPMGLDMLGNVIKNLGEGTNPTDAATLGQVQEIARAAQGADTVVQNISDLPSVPSPFEGMNTYIRSTGQTFIYVIDEGETTGQWTEKDQLGDDVDVTAASHLTLAQAQASDLKVGQYVRLIDRDLGLFQVKTTETPNGQDILDITNGRQLKLSLNQRLTLDMVGDANRFVVLLNEQNVDFATSAKVFGLPKNSALYLGQVLLWQGAGGNWSTGNNNNLSCGQSSMGRNSTGYSNSAFGYETLSYNSTGYNNSAFGKGALLFNTTGSECSAFGVNALLNNTTAEENTALGRSALEQNTIGENNTAGGYKALQANVTSSGHTAFGNNCGSLITGGSNSSSFGFRALLCEDTVSTGATADRCNAFGYESQRRNKSGSANNSFGAQSLVSNETGAGNCAFGDAALRDATNQNNNTAFGTNALQAILGGGNTAVGANAMITGNGSQFRNNCTALGANTLVTGSNQVQLGDSATTTYAYGAVQDRSDARDKLDIKDLTDAHIAFFMDVEWKQYRMNHRERYIEVVDGEIVEVENDGSRAGTRYHIGAVAQQVEEAMKKHNIDFAGLQHHAVNGGEDVYSIGYQEFIGIQGLIIQRQQNAIDDILVRLDKAGI